MLEGLSDRVLYAEELCESLAKSGRPSMIVPPGSLRWLTRERFATVISHVAVERASFSAVSVMLRGNVWPRQTFAQGFFVAVQGLHEREVLPIQYHFIVRNAGSAPRTKLRSEMKGILRRERVRLRWEGSLLALQLAADTALMRTLEGLTDHDSITIEPEPGNGLCRVILQRYMYVTYSVFSKEKLSIKREPLTKDLLEALDRISARARESSAEAGARLLGAT